MQIRGCAQRYCRSRLAWQVGLAMDGPLRRGVTEGGKGVVPHDYWWVTIRSKTLTTAAEPLPSEL